jgi:hypothetical protein
MMPAAAPSAAAMARRAADRAIMHLLALGALVGLASAGEPTAHAPDYADTAVWPMLGGAERFTRQAIPPTRVMVWAKPGAHGSIEERKGGMLDPTDLANWTENGKPATEPPDLDTDLVFPASDKPYKVSMRNQYGKVVGWGAGARNVTVESGAFFHCGGSSLGFRLGGNLWIKRGGAFYCHSGLTFAGLGDTFLRQDNPEDVEVGAMSSPARTGVWRIAQYLTFSKEESGSVEILGPVTCLDEFRVERGSLIIGRGVSVGAGRRAAPIVRAGAVMALLDGASWYTWSNTVVTRDLEVFGEVCGGLPERPLTANATLGISFKNAGATAAPGASGKTAFDRVPGLVLRGGTLRSHSTDPAKARLMVRWNGVRFIQDLRPPPGSAAEAAIRAKDGSPEQAYMTWFDALPHTIDCWVSAQSQIRDVGFDDLRAGGLMLEKADDRSRLTGLTFGPGCAAKGEALFSAVALDKNCKY